MSVAAAQGETMYILFQALELCKDKSIPDDWDVTVEGQSAVWRRK